MLAFDVDRFDADERDWVRAHTALSRLARERANADAEEGRWLLRAVRSAAHVHVGYGSFAEYIERLFGYTPRSIQEKLRVAEALETLPRLAAALETGTLSWSAVRELTRVATPDAEQAWIDAAQKKTVRQLEQLVASKHPGDDPSTPSPARPRRHVLRFEVEADTFALFREAIQQLRRRAGAALDDDDALLSMARCVLGGPGDDDRSSYQVSLTVCATCASGAQQAAGQLVPVDTHVVAMAECDGQHLGHLLPRAANDGASRGATERTSPNQANAHVGTDDAGANTAAPRRGRRAKQCIPPAVRRAVLARDQRRCRAPGCTHATFVDVHHIQPRAEGGRNEPTNLITLCRAHHRAAHRGELIIEAKSDGDVNFCHADGTAYGMAITPQAVDVQAKVFSALRNLGFREREIRGVLDELRREAGPCAATAEGLLREALCRIR